MAFIRKKAMVFLFAFVVVLVICWGYAIPQWTQVTDPSKSPPMNADTGIIVTNGKYTAHGLMFNFSLMATGEEIQYINRAGEVKTVRAGDNEKILQFHGTITSLDGNESFYQLLTLVDDEGNVYESVCPVDRDGDCKNTDTLTGFGNPRPGQTVSGTVYFCIPKTVNHVNLVYDSFLSNDDPQVVKFSFTV